ncbi:WXG100 family type VII secretion target [Corynebacterium felinum]|uniref:WXG100 family type VII secretion target n=1 Tax=Corynebacterium felinum TaxID=131318 RepID=A0ABU2B6Z3_9CORY|nr:MULTISPECIES: WXG100 family type VII secretion target [Corynebacterium]MDF5819757.1 WXG100 family type VII secretion target [Corynebacterium felinum]MDO4762465.1 WXG100 family type VII secretion target [Corynebacterium sp.]MDR7354377.1 WXG100 family type VII secretion target [Corynebacterium felinum]WJY93748.1 WXG domain conatining protein [Corynebacterium felinum]
MSTEFAFRTTTATDSAANILAVRDKLVDILDAIDDSLAELRPQWSASEADGYQEVMSQWHEGACGIRDILNDVSSTLSQINEANTELRGGIKQLLDQIT